MLPTINERSERALERWQKLRRSLGRAVSATRPVRKGRFTIETYSSSEKYSRRPKTLKSGKFGRFEVHVTKPKRSALKNSKNYLEKQRNRIQRAVNAIKNSNRRKYQNELNALKARHKVELNAIKKRHEENENSLYNKHFSKKTKISQLLQALNNINNQLRA
jgi:hypothetical protein